MIGKINLAFLFSMMFIFKLSAQSIDLSSLNSDIETGTDAGTGLTIEPLEGVANKCEDYVIDIKTTNDMSKFMYSCKTYNYDSQAYLYQRFFNRPLRFFVIDKQSFQLGIYDCSANFVEGGKNKVEKATEIYNKFFSNDKSHDINNYIHKEVL